LITKDQNIGTHANIEVKRCKVEIFLRLRRISFRTKTTGQTTNSSSLHTEEQGNRQQTADYLKRRKEKKNIGVNR
jgi:hypothetical protein